MTHEKNYLYRSRLAANLWLDATVIAQNTQETSSENDCTAKPDACVVVNYDRFKNSTSVVTRPFYVDTGKFWNTLSLTAVYSSPGKDIIRPNEVGFLFTVTFTDVHGGDQPAFATSKDVDLLIDGKAYPLGNVSLGRFENESVRQEWSYVLFVPFKVIESIASAKDVEMRAGSVEFKFDNNFKASFRRLVELTPKEIVAPKKEEVPLAKPPTPKPTPRRRRGRP
jgi:hypothetical protein